MLSPRHLLRRPATTPAPPANSPPPAVAETLPLASDLLAPPAVADLLQVTTKVLERWRGTGDGPRFVRLTRKTIRYRLGDVEGFIAARVRSSTADA
jgi:hypothetical protein